MIKIKGWTVLQTAPCEAYNHNTDIFKKLLSSSSISTASAAHPSNVLELISEVIDKEINYSFILDLNLFNKNKRDDADAIQKLISNKYFRLYIHPHMTDLISFSVCDSAIILRLLTNHGTLDNTRLINSSQEAIQWGRELFEYYLKDSTPITEI